MKLNVPKIKSEIKALARALRENKEKRKQADRDKKNSWGLAPSDEVVAELESVFEPEFLSRTLGRSKVWCWWKVSTYFTRLCCLRASWRGRLHFSPKTESGTAQSLGIKFPITFQHQSEWALEIDDRYRVEQTDEVHEGLGASRSGM